jgi:outer membrane receptor protein involved in Fe transport
MRLFANAQQSIRRPTLGERYETYGQGFVITEPNQSLRTEHITSMEVGAEYRPLTKVTLGATAFLNELRDALGKQIIAQKTSASPIVGELPAGYFVQQRVNLDRARVQGMKLSASWRPSSSFSIEGNVIFNDPNILRCSAATQLAGRQMAQVSRRTAVLSARWQASRNLSFRLRVRSMGRQFVDDENALRLGDAVIADIGASYAVTEHAELFLTAENVADAVVQTGRSTTGLVCIGEPRVILGGLRWKW